MPGPSTTPRILGPNGQPLAVVVPPPRAAAPPRAVRARFDVAQTNQENRKLWAPADGLSARAANSPEVRYKLRTRARYETDNNSYCEGIVQTLANDVIGTGPRLQLMTGDPTTDRRIGEAFEQWTAEVGLAEKLRTMRRARAVDGEAFALLVSNPGLTGEVQLDLRLVEADQVASPYLFSPSAQSSDGIRFDRFGNPVAYDILREHPGDTYSSAATFGEYETLPARLVLHWFRARRPGQVRGIPDITPALPLFGLLRRYTLAVIAAAETAADFAAVLYSELGPDTEAVDGDPFETLEIDRRMMTTLPAGWKMTQFKAEQPTTTYAQFKAEILNEIARCLGMPFNIAAGNSSGYNYSSGRLDHQTYYKGVGIEQYECETVVLNHLFMAWLEEAWLVTDLLPQPPGRLAGWPHQWFWDGVLHVDPVKEAIAQQARLRNGTTTLADEWAQTGYDWREKADQRAVEREYYASKGMTYPGDTPAPHTAADPAAAPTGDGNADPNAD